MTARSIRRAQERKLRKAAGKAARSAQSQPVEAASEACLAANRANAMDEPALLSEVKIQKMDEPELSEAKTRKTLSTGPRTEAGKAISSLNAVRTGLTGRTVLLPSDDAEAYHRHVSAYESAYRPVGLRETELVQSLADTQWRLQRIPGLEMALYARGRQEFAESYLDQDIALRANLIDLDVHLKYEKQLRNLQLQESRLHRRYEKEMAELRQLQQERSAAADDQSASEATETRQTNVAAEFVFSNEIPPVESHPLFATLDSLVAHQS
jgi:hypothetical protein